MTAKSKPTPKLKTPLKKVQKDTIYVDNEDDITALINSVKKSSSSIVAIVLPKNAQVLQSIVNMKLLKRAATKQKKNIALVTADKSIHTLAGVAGVHVAETANSKPFIPTVNIEDVDGDDAPDAVVAMGAGMAAATKTTDSSLSDDGVSEDTAKEVSEDKEATSAATVAAVKAKNKKFKVPDFGSFQTKLILGVVGFITLVILWYIGFVVMPKATISVQTNTQSIPVSDSITLDYSEDATVNVDERVLPALRVTTEKTNEATEEATGEKNIGEKAEGKVTMSAQVCGAISSPSNVPKGTGVSADGKTYITQEDASFSFDSFDGSCLNFNGDTVAIIAQESGEEYDTAKNTSFTVSGRSDVDAVGDASGGTTEIITVVSDEDVAVAKASLGEAARGEALQELRQKLTEAGYTAMDVTLDIKEPKYAISPIAGEEGESVTVKQTVEYELTGYKDSDMSVILDAVLAETLSEENETKNVSDNGLSGITFESTGENDYSFSTVAVIGPSLDVDALAEEFAGKKRGEIIDRLESIDGVVSAEVNYSPMWITTTPKSAEKITIEVQSQ